MASTTMERAKEESDKTYKFIELLQQHPAVWDIKSREYKDRDAKRKGNEEIAKELDLTVPQVLEKYKNLRTYYTKERRKIDNSMKSGCGTTEVYRSKWEFFDALDKFLRDTLKVRTASSNLVQQKGSDIEDEDGTAEDGATEQPDLTPQSKRKRQRKEDELLMTAIDILKTPAPSQPKPQPQSKDAIFAALIQSELESMDDCKRKDLLKLKIQQLFVEYKYDNDNETRQSQPSANFQFRPYLPQPMMFGQSPQHNSQYNFSHAQSHDNSY